MSKRGPQISLLIFVAVAALYLVGAFSKVDRIVQDGLFEVSRRDSAEQVVLVEIDAKSLAQLDVWPWVRSYHAKVLTRLIDAGAIAVAIDVDFTARTVASQDRALADAIRRANGRVVLPVFHRRARNASGRLIETFADPIGAFARNAELASADIPRDADGRARHYELGATHRERTLPSLATQLARWPHSSREIFGVDLGIRLSTVPRISFADILAGDFDQTMVARKVVIVGATAVELGGRLNAPVYGTLSSPEYHALAYESIVQGRMIKDTNPWITLSVALMVTAFLGRWYREARPLVAGLASLAFVPGSFATAAVIQWIAPVSLELVPWWAVVALSYAAHQIMELDRRAYQILTHRPAARRSRALLDSLVDDGVDAIVIAEAGGVVRLFNPMAGRLLRLPPDAAVGRPLADVVPEFAGLVSADEAEGGRTGAFAGHGARQECTLHRRTGEQFPAEVTVSVSRLRPEHQAITRRQGGGRVYIFTFRDITDRKRTEAAERKAMEEAIAANRAKSEFLANISHELRTPLNAIIGFSEMMKTEMFGPMGADQYRDYATDIHASGSHLLEVINDILDMSKIEAGAMKLQEQTVDLVDVVESCLRLIRERARDAGLTVTADPPPGLPPLNADPRLLKQILLNLLSNAVKFTPSGGAVTVSCRLSKSGAMSVAVADTGIGMETDDIPKALAAFGQVDTRLARNYEGTGLGLPLVKSMAELHGATVDIESEPGRGTTVTVTFGPERSVERETRPPKRRRKAGNA